MGDIFEIVVTPVVVQAFWLVMYPWKTWNAMIWKYKMKKWVKVKFPLSTSWRHIGGVEVWLHSFLTSALAGSEWSVSCPSCLTAWRESWYPLNSRLCGPQSHSGWSLREKASLAIAGTWTPDSPTCRWSCTDCSFQALWGKCELNFLWWDCKVRHWNSVYQSVLTAYFCKIKFNIPASPCSFK